MSLELPGPLCFMLMVNLHQKVQEVWDREAVLYAVSQSCSLHNFRFNHKLFCACDLFRSRRHKGCRGKGHFRRRV